MNPEPDQEARRERGIAALLWYGTWLASAVIAAGMVLGDDGIARTGVALLIGLPIARVAVLLVLFLRERDYAYVALSALVLAIIGAGVVAGL